MRLPTAPCTEGTLCASSVWKLWLGHCGLLDGFPIIYLLIKRFNHFPLSWLYGNNELILSLPIQCTIETVHSASKMNVFIVYTSLKPQWKECLKKKNKSQKSHAQLLHIACWSLCAHQDEFYMKISCHVISPRSWIHSDMKRTCGFWRRKHTPSWFSASPSRTQ